MAHTSGSPHPIHVLLVRTDTEHDGHRWVVAVTLDPTDMPGAVKLLHSYRRKHQREGLEAVVVSLCDASKNRFGALVGDDEFNPLSDAE